MNRSRSAVARRRLARALFGLAVLSMSTWAGCAVPQPRGEGKLQRIVEPSTKRGYWLYLPKEYIAADDSARRARHWPLVVSFHGMKPFDTARAQACEWQQESDRYGFVVVAPELGAPDVLQEFPLEGVTNQLAEDERTSLAILDHVVATTQADPSHTLATGWSSGGYMAHYMLNRHPDRFTALGVRQANFSAGVLDYANTSRSKYHPVMIANTENDFAVCKRESKEAVQWYHNNGYKNVAWIYIKDKGHERTPDIAASFFARVAGVKPNRPPEVLVSRQAIDGNPEGLALLSGRLSDLKTPDSNTRYVSASPGAVTPPRPAPILPQPQPMPARSNPAVARPPAPRAARPLPANYRMQPPVTIAALPRPSGGAAERTQAMSIASGAGSSEPASVSTPPRRTAPTTTSRERAPVSVRVSSAIGMEPLYLGFSADCPSDWHATADFLWTLNGDPVCNGVNGQKTLAEPGEHTLGLLVVTPDGQEHRAYRLIRVLPRISASGHSVSTNAGG
jgi:poly(3-hydroxybutyrate) depolymerase